MHKLCQDCQWLSKRLLCKSPQNVDVGRPDYVHGRETKDIPLWYTAQACREADKACGPEAKWFMPLPPASTTVADPRLEERCPDGPNYQA